GQRPAARPPRRLNPEGSAALGEGLVEGIAGAAHRADRVAAASEGAPQAPDMHVDGALVDEHVMPPYTVEKLGAGIDAAGILHEEFEQAKLGRAEMQVAPLAAHAMRLAVELELAGAQDGGDEIGLGAAQDGA